MRSALPSCLALFSVFAGVLLGASPVVLAQDPTATGEDFPGIKKALTPEQYAATGLDKLSPDERAKLDEYLRGYFTGATQQVVQKAVAQASAKAVDQAVKERRVEPPQLIESHIIGTVDGWRSGQIFVLENGEHWKVTDNEHHYFPPIANPDVFIVHADFFGYKMAIAGGGTVRVVRTK